MCRENGVAVADYTVHIIFCPLEHVTEVVSFCLFVFFHIAIIYPDYGIVKDKYDCLYKQQSQREKSRVCGIVKV